MSRGFYTQTEVKARGWSQTLIESVLGAPDKYARTWTRGRRSGRPAKQWSKQRVEATEKSSQAFIGYQDKRAAASARSMKVAERKRGELRDDLGKLDITVQVISSAEAIARGIRNWETRQARRRRKAGNGGDADAATKRRWAINYIRHNLCTYDAERHKIAGRTGQVLGIALIRRMVYEAIAEAYPDFAEECRRQARQRGAAA